MAAPLARARGGNVHVLHVLEEDVVAGEDTIELETRESAEQLLNASMVELRKSGMPVTGELLHTIGNHADAAARILERAAELDVGAIVIGPETERGALLTPVAGNLAEHSDAHVVVLHPAAGALGSQLPLAA
jgi:nucleotide-binding universal stress UspA family protein